MFSGVVVVVHVDHYVHLHNRMFMHLQCKPALMLANVFIHCLQLAGHPQYMTGIRTYSKSLNAELSTLAGVCRSTPRLVCVYVCVCVCVCPSWCRS